MQSENRSNIDPIVAAAMAHYQFETLHPFNDGNGRIGRLLIVLHLMTMNVINEPMLSVSEWFESRRAEYFDSLLEVSATGNWDGWINFFSRGIEYSARAADSRLTDLLAARKNLRDKIDKSKLTSISAMKLVDFALGNIIFNAKNVQEHLELTYPRANSLINQLVELGILKELGRSGRTKHYMAPDVYSIYTG